MPFLTAFARLAGSVAPLTRGMTLGVRGCCIDAEGRVFLVRHSYMPGWYLPGGGVERDETALVALGRELDEEAGIRLATEPELFGVYYNRRQRRDHVLVFVSRDFSRPSPPGLSESRDRRGRLLQPVGPSDAVTPATRRRLDEILAGAVRDPSGECRFTSGGGA